MEKRCDSDPECFLEITSQNSHLDCLQLCVKRAIFVAVLSGDQGVSSSFFFKKAGDQAKRKVTSDVYPVDKT